MKQVNELRAALSNDRAEDVILEFVGDADHLWAVWDGLPRIRRSAIAAALAVEVVVWPATNTGSRGGERTGGLWSLHSCAVLGGVLRKRVLLHTLSTQTATR
jgi:hypothetical protein